MEITVKKFGLLLSPFILIVVLLCGITVQSMNNNTTLFRGFNNLLLEHQGTEDKLNQVLDAYEGLTEQYNDLVEKYNVVVDAYNSLAEKPASGSQVGLQTEIHSRVRMWKNGVLIFDEYNAGVVTDIGDNQTLAWIFGDTNYNVTAYMMNVTYISIGNQGSVSSAITILPGEWNRTLATLEDQSQSWLNLTCTFYPDAGPHTADCIGLNWISTNASDNNLYAYDTFTEVTGIDDTFEIGIEFKVTVAHA